jgi:hypothetical protein
MGIAPSASFLGEPWRTANHHRAAAGIDRAAPSNRSASPKRPCRAACLLEADGRGNHGGLFFAIKPSFDHREYSGEGSTGDTGLQCQSYSGQLRRFWAAQIPKASLGLRRGLAQPKPILRLGRTSPHSLGAIAERRIASFTSAGSRRAPYNRRASAFLIRSPTRQRALASLPRFFARG